MILSDSEILLAYNDQDLIINPFKKENLNSCSYTLHLGEEIKVYTNEILDCMVHNTVKSLVIPKEGAIIRGERLYLGHTIEVVGSEKYAFTIKGLSSLARLGLSIDQTANFGGVGFQGQITLELSVLQPLKIYKGMPIAQIVFEEVKGVVDCPYNKAGGSYMNQKGAQESKFFKKFPLKS